MKTNFVFTGGRMYDDEQRVEEICELLKSFRAADVGKIHVGCAKGLDELVRRQFQGWAEVFFQVHRADWEKHGRAAGPIRNREMLQAAGPRAILIAFPGGAGTANCIDQALGMGYTVLRVDHPSKPKGPK
jgi:hypothetical protein